MKERIVLKDIEKLIIIIISIIAILIILFFSLKKDDSDYVYLTTNGEWGKSKVCGIDENQNTYCYIDNELSLVKQFYKEK